MRRWFQTTTDTGDVQYLSFPFKDQFEEFLRASERATTFFWYDPVTSTGDPGICSNGGDHLFLPQPTMNVITLYGPRLDNILYNGFVSGGGLSAPPLLFQEFEDPPGHT